MFKIRNIIRIYAIALITIIIASHSTVLASGNNDETESDPSYVIDSQGLEEYEDSSDYQEYWYSNLPIYDGETISLAVDVQAVRTPSAKTSPDILGKSIASIQILRLAESCESYFSHWKNVRLTAPTAIYRVNDNLYGQAYGVVDRNSRILGYVVVGTDVEAPPVLEYSYDPSRFLKIKDSNKVYYSCQYGLLCENDNVIARVDGETTVSLSEITKSEDSVTAKAFRDECENDYVEQWNKFADYATISEKSLDEKEINSEEQKENYTRSTQTRLSMDTSDYTWQTLCSYTTMTMYFDAIGRRIEPAILGTTRPHSIQLNQTLHSLYGCKPSFSQIADNSLAWVNSKKLSSSLSFSKYHVYSSNSSCWSKHKTQINKNIPTMVGYSSANGVHIMMGIGYTSDNYYIVRDTWTYDGNPMNSTFYYNKSGYSFQVLGLDYSTPSSGYVWRSGTLRQGDSNINVRRLKIMLYLLYYNPGSLTSNYFDEQTKNAVMAFQSDNGLTADGIVGSNTYTKLVTAHIMKYDGNTANWRVLSLGKKGDDVAQLQIRLYRMGYYNGTCDGSFGPATKNALIQYQTAKNLTPDGIAGSATFAKLYGSYNSYIRQYLPCSTCSS